MSPIHASTYVGDLYSTVSKVCDVGENGRPIIFTDLHKEWSDLVKKHSYLHLWIPRDHGKTVFFDYLYSWWQSSKKSFSNGVIYVPTKHMVHIFIYGLMDFVKANRKMCEINGIASICRSGSGRICGVRFANHSIVYIQVLGDAPEHSIYDWVVVDDAYLEYLGPRFDDWQRIQISSFLKSFAVIPGYTQVVVIGTPPKSYSIYSELRDNKKWKDKYFFKKYEAPFEKPLLPELYSKKELLSKCADIGKERFQMEFLCEGPSSELRARC